MKFSLIHPSRSRPVLAIKRIQEWVLKANNPLEVEYILSIDISDPLMTLYQQDFKTLQLENKKICVFDNENVVQATNHGAALSTGEILIYLSDDFSCPDHWDTLLLESIPEGPLYLLKVDDCLQRFHIPVLTIPIMSRPLYLKLGYFWYPQYKSMFVDEDLYWTCKNNNWIVQAPHLKFPHLHCSTGKVPKDETYIRSEKNWDQGKQLFRKRKVENFPL